MANLNDVETRMIALCKKSPITQTVLLAEALRLVTIIGESFPSTSRGKASMMHCLNHLLDALTSIDERVTSGTKESEVGRQQ